MSAPRDVMEMRRIEARIRRAAEYRRSTLMKMLDLETELNQQVSRQYTIEQEGTQLTFSTAQLLRHYGKWTKYYSAQIERDTIQLRKLQQTPSTLETLADRAKQLPLPALVLLVMVLGLGFTALVQPELTGFAVKDKTKQYTDRVNEQFTANAEWLFSPEQQDPTERITSLKLSGSVEGSGTARVLLDGKVVLEYTLTPTVAGPPTAPTEPAAEPTPEESIEPAPQPSEVPVEESVEESVEEPVEQPADAGLGDLTGAVVLEQDRENFNLECIDSCALDIARQDAYALTIEVDGVALSIDSVAYTLGPVPVETTNATADATEPSVSTSTNATTQNATVVNATAATALAPGERELAWNMSNAKPKKARDSTGKEGKYAYEELEQGETIDFIGKIGRIEATAVIPIDAIGAIVAREDYLNGGFLKLSVEAEGVISLTLSDGTAAVLLETGKAYNDGQAHTIVAELDGTTAWIDVDGVREAEGSIASISDLQSTVPIAIGANAGYVEYFGEPIEQFTGTIQAVRVRGREAKP